MEFDSHLFGMRIGRLGDGPLTEIRARAAVEWSRVNRVRCLYYLCPAHDAKSMAIAQQFGFLVVDVRVTFAITSEDYLKESGSPTPSPLDGDIAIRSHLPSDVSELTSIAATSYTDTRFYQDPRFAREACDRLYEIWVEKSCRGYAEAVLVADVEGQPAGFITCHLTPKGEGNIGLVGVSEHARGRRLGKMLVRAALDWFAQRGTLRVTVVTQGRNLAAQRLYQRSGFLTNRVDLWLHRWSENEHDASPSV